MNEGPAGVRSECELRIGEGLEIAPGTPHQMFNRSDDAAEFLVVSHPHSHGDRELVSE